jgi:eukaryotic-like serine/threonine-protein kinase
MTLWPKESISDRVPPIAGANSAVGKRNVKKPTPFGKYYLLERINVGGMAEVFRAKAFGVEGFERLVAVKRILPNIAEDKEFIRMFIEEAKLAVQLNHANIAQIFDLGVVDGSYYIALEHVHGRDLRAMFDRCRQLGDPMPVSQACFAVMKVCEGLDYAHNKRDQAGRELHLVHRDVSPQNILVSFEGEVKLIDFGIAKAAGKGSKTQAGILKGKFGYMSPEQVRGIPVDRRSDVFSCGIVLYELLTGERLFVGESDFSTLEKVRNVEILPPSTYNRRIPDELERIVLKALAKDPEERYQNAIDLHDELQAFVYTAGEFYSRKDLAGWMKKTFGREIEEETAKLETYRQLKAPVSDDTATSAINARGTGGSPAVGRVPTGTRPPTGASPQAVRKSSPSGPNKAPPPPPNASRPSGQMTAPLEKARPSGAGMGAGGPRKGLGLNAEALAWDDDELETQIYDNPDDAPRRGKATGGHASLPLASPPATPAPGPALNAAAAAAAAAHPPPVPALPPVSAGPDLSSLVSTGKGWGEPAAPPSPASTITGHAPGAGANGASLPPAQIATGSNKGPAPTKPSAEDPLAALAASYSSPASSSARDLPVPRQSDSMFADPMSSFGQGMLARQQSGSRTTLFLAIGGAALAVAAVVVIIAMSGGKKTTKPATDTASTGSAATGTTAATPTPPPAGATGDQNTGFDLYVVPAGTMTWRLDGDARTDRLPSKIRGVAPGAHTIAIDAPPGFMSQNMPITVEAGKAPKVEIVLQPLDIAGAFDSTPAGAKVSLIVDGKREALGPAPAKTKLDPRKSYYVLFELPGYVSVNRPITFTGGLEEKIAVTLEKAGAANPAMATAALPVTTPPKNDKKVTTTPGGTGPVTRPDKTTPKTDKTDKTDVAKTDTKVEKTDPKPEKPEIKDAVATSGGQGTLLLGSKPPCEIFIDGKSTGLHTPQKDIKLASGKHKVTLVNNEYGIKETFSVDIKPDATEKQIKDYSDRLPK